MLSNKPLGIELNRSDTSQRTARHIAELAVALRGSHKIEINQVIINKQSSSGNHMIYLEGENQRIAIGTIKMKRQNNTLIIQEGKGIDIKSPELKTAIPGLRNSIYSMIIETIITTAVLGGCYEIVFECQGGKCPILNLSQEYKKIIGSHFRSRIDKVSFPEGSMVISLKTHIPKEESRVVGF